MHKELSKISSRVVDDLLALLFLANVTPFSGFPMHYKGVIIELELASMSSPM
jgi:hypothetical protein